MYNTMATMQKIEDAAITSSSTICRSSRLVFRIMPSRFVRYALAQRVSSRRRGKHGSISEALSSRARSKRFFFHFSNAPSAQRDYVLHQHGLFHHERLAVFRAHQVAVEPRDRSQSFADL